VSEPLPTFGDALLRDREESSAAKVGANLAGTDWEKNGGIKMTVARTLSLIAGLVGFAVLTAGCRTVTSVETFKYGFSDLESNVAAGADRRSPEDFLLRAKSWKHQWRCSVFDSCETDFLSTLYVFDKRTGRQIKWNRVEVFLAEDCDASADDRRKYKTVVDTDVVSLGWGEDRNGKYDRVSALLVFYADWGSVNARMRTRACP